MSTTASSTSTSLSPDFSIDCTYGALLIGTFLSLILYGWALNQCFRYFRVYENDRWSLKGLVIIMLMLETFNVVLYIHICYYYLISGYTDEHALSKTIWSFDLLGISTIAVAFVCELFYLRRVYLIGRKLRTLVVLAAALVVAELVIATYSTVISLVHPDQRGQTDSWLNCAGVGTAVLADTLLTTALIVSLHRSRTGIEQTNNLIDRLIAYTISTGLLVGLFNALSLFFAIASPNSMIYVAIDIVTTVLYANSIMTVLNARGESLRLPSDRVIDLNSISLSALPSQQRPSTVPATLGPVSIASIPHTRLNGRLKPYVRTQKKSIEIVVVKDIFMPDGERRHSVGVAV